MIDTNGPRHGTVAAARTGRPASPPDSGVVLADALDRHACDRVPPAVLRD